MVGRTQSIFPVNEVKHGLSLFNADEPEAIEKLPEDRPRPDTPRGPALVGDRDQDVLM